MFQINVRGGKFSGKREASNSEEEHGGERQQAHQRAAWRAASQDQAQGAAVPHVVTVELELVSSSTFTLPQLFYGQLH